MNSPLQVKEARVLLFEQYSMTSDRIDKAYIPKLNQ